MVESPYAKSFAASLASEEIVELNGNQMSFTLKEIRAKDARAMWNTRMRSLIVADNMIRVINSTSNNNGE